MEDTLISGAGVSRRRQCADLRGALPARVDDEAVRDVVRHLQPLRPPRRPHVLLRAHLGRRRINGQIGSDALEVLESAARHFDTWRDALSRVLSQRNKSSYCLAMLKIVVALLILICER